MISALLVLSLFWCVCDLFFKYKNKSTPKILTRFKYKTLVPIIEILEEEFSADIKLLDNSKLFHIIFQYQDTLMYVDGERFIDEESHYNGLICLDGINQAPEDAARFLELVCKLKDYSEWTKPG